MLGSLISKIILIGLLFSCATPVRKHLQVVETNYHQSFLIVKSYITECFRPQNLRANLYTDISEAEIILDRLSGSTIYVIGTSVMSPTSRASDVLNIKFVGQDGGTLIETTTELSRSVVERSLSRGPCLPRK